MRGKENVVHSEDDFLHVGAIILDYLRFLKRSCRFLLPAMAICAVVAVAIGAKAYTPRYSATVYYAVDRSFDVSADASLASRVSSSVSVVSATSDFQEQLLDAMGAERIPVSYSFSGTLMESTNLFSVTVVCSGRDLANELIAAFQEVYPTWVGRFSGCGIRPLLGEELSNGEPVNSWSPVVTGFVGALAAAALWFAAATVYVISIRRVNTSDDMYQVVESECLGVLPDVRKTKKNLRAQNELLITNQYVNKEYLYSVRSMRARIEELVSEKGVKSVLLTSTLPQEGKTLLTTNLALSLSIRGKRILVVDADPAASGFSKSFGSSEKYYGLSDYLDGRAGSIEELIQEKSGLFFISSGRSTANSRKVLDEKKMNELMDTLRDKNFDLILIDAPSVCTVSDAVMYADYVDQVFYVVRGDYAQINEIRKGIEPFIQSEKLGGYILNRVSNPRSYRHYGYTYSAYNRFDIKGKNGSYNTYYGNSVL